MVDKIDSVFVSYRRTTSKHAALLVFKDLDQQGYDVFIDYQRLDSGKFAAELLHQIASRRHFVVILSPGCLDRVVNQDDWLRKEIEYAIDSQRNIVPLLFDDFNFASAKQFLTGTLSALPEYNGLTVPDGYFDEAMNKLRSRFLKQPVKGSILRASTKDHQFAQAVLRQAHEAARGNDAEVAWKKYLNPLFIGNKPDPEKELPFTRPRLSSGYKQEAARSESTDSLRRHATNARISRQILISYRRTDSADVAGRIYDRLIDKFGAESIFKDVDSIPAGVNFREALERIVRECKVVLVIIGDRWVDAAGAIGEKRLYDHNDYVRIEIEAALALGILLLPVLVGAAHMPNEESLPPSLKPLLYRNAVQIRPDPDFHRDMDRLISILGTYMK